MSGLYGGTFGLPFGDEGGALPVYGSSTVEVDEALSITTALTDEIAAYLTAAAAGTTALTTLLQSYPVLIAGAEADAGIVIALLALASAEGEVDATLTSMQAVLEAIEAALVASGEATTRQDAEVAVIAAATIEAMLAAGWAVEAIGTAEFNAALLTELRITLALQAEAAAAASAVPHARLTVTMAEGADAETVIATQQRLFEHVQAGAEVYLTIRLGADEYSGWVLNPAIGAVSEYRNYPFNSFIAWGKHHYGVTDDGLFLLNTGDDDDGDDITAWIRTALETFGTMRKKRTPSVYYTGRHDGSFLLKVAARDKDTGDLIEDWYLGTPTQAGTAHHTTRIKVGRGIEAVSLAYELRNVDGADFATDEIAWLPLLLEGRLG